MHWNSCQWQPQSTAKESHNERTQRQQRWRRRQEGSERVGEQRALATNLLHTLRRSFASSMCVCVCLAPRVCVCVCNHCLCDIRLASATWALCSSGHWPVDCLLSCLLSCPAPCPLAHWDCVLITLNFNSKWKSRNKRKKRRKNERKIMLMPLQKLVSSALKLFAVTWEDCHMHILNANDIRAWDLKI